MSRNCWFWLVSCCMLFVVAYLLCMIWISLLLSTSSRFPLLSCVCLFNAFILDVPSSRCRRHVFCRYFLLHCAGNYEITNPNGKSHYNPNHRSSHRHQEQHVLLLQSTQVECVPNSFFIFSFCIRDNYAIVAVVHGKSICIWFVVFVSVV